MANWFGIYASILIPSSAVVLLYTLDKFQDWRLGLGIIFGVVMLVAGILALRVSWQAVIRENKEDDDRFLILMKEIRGFRDDMKEDSGGRTTYSHNKM